MGVMILCSKCTEALEKRLKELKKEAAGKNQVVQVDAECDGCHKLLRAEDEIFCKSCYQKKGYNLLQVR